MKKVFSFYNITAPLVFVFILIGLFNLAKYATSSLSALSEQSSAGNPMLILAAVVGAMVIKQMLERVQSNAFANLLLIVVLGVGVKAMWS